MNTVEPNFTQRHRHNNNNIEHRHHQQDTYWHPGSHIVFKSTHYKQQSTIYEGN